MPHDVKEGPAIVKPAVAQSSAEEEKGKGEERKKTRGEGRNQGNQQYQIELPTNVAHYPFLRSTSPLEQPRTASILQQGRK